MAREIPEYVDIEVDVPVDHTTTRSGLRGRLDRMMKDYMLKAGALRIAIGLIDDDDRATALNGAPQKFLKALQHRDGDDAAPVLRKKSKRKTLVRESSAERRATITQYLVEHPGANTNEIAQALGWQNNMALKFASQVATTASKRKRGGQRQPHEWTLRGRKASKANGHVPQRTLRKPKQERLDQIQGFLQRNPSATTRSIARVVGLKPNSSFVKMLRTIARPAGPTKGTQPIQWVLTS